MTVNTNVFDLVFKGEVQPRRDVEQVKSRMASYLQIDDPAIWDIALSGDELLSLFEGRETPLTLDPGGIVNPPGPLPPLGDVTLGENGGIRFTLPAGLTGDIEYSLDLIEWEVIASDVSGVFEETDPGRIAEPEGYYRAAVR